MHYKVDTKEVSEWILKKLKNGNLRNSRMDSEETQESLTEITTEITTETTNIIYCRATRLCLEYLIKKLLITSMRKLVKTSSIKQLKQESLLKQDGTKILDWTILKGD